MKENTNLVDVVLLCGIATIFSSPFIYGAAKNGVKYSSYSMLKKHLTRQNVKIYQGPLKNKHEKFIVQKIVKEMEMEMDLNFSSNDSAGINIKRFLGGWDFLHNDSSVDTYNEDFHYWLKWDHKTVKDCGNYSLEISSIYSGNNKTYTVAYIPRQHHIEYLCICDGEFSDMKNSIDKERITAGIKFTMNVMPITYILGKTILILSVI